MPAADDSPDGIVYDPTDQLRHDLKTPLTTIAGRAHLLAREHPALAVPGRRGAGDGCWRDWPPSRERSGRWSP